MSDVTEIGDTNELFSECLQSSNQNSGMNTLQANPVFGELSSILQLPEKLIQEPENSNSKCVVHLTKLELQSNTIENDSDNDSHLEICTKYTNYQKCANSQSFTMDLNMPKIENQYVSKGTQILYQNAQAFEQSEVKFNPIMKTADEQWDNLPRQTFLQESKQQYEHKNFALIPKSSLPPITENDNGNHPSSTTSKEIVHTRVEVIQSDDSITSNEQWDNLPRQTFLQESKQQYEHKNLAPIPKSSLHPIPEIDNSNHPSSTTSKEIVQTHDEVIQSRQILSYDNTDAPMLTYLMVKMVGSDSELEESLIFLDCMKRIGKWFAKLDELNQYNTTRFQALLDKMIDFQRLESLVKEKQVMLAIGMDLSLSAFQTSEGSDYEISTYRSLCDHCERILRLLKLYERYLNSAYERHRKLRNQYLDCSIQIAMYPIEEKLFENRKKTMNIINQSSSLMNKMSSKLEETDNFTDNLSFECISIVKKFFRDCENTFSQQ